MFPTLIVATWLTYFQLLVFYVHGGLRQEPITEECAAAACQARVSLIHCQAGDDVAGTLRRSSTGAWPTTDYLPSLPPPQKMTLLCVDQRVIKVGISARQRIFGVVLGGGDFLQVRQGIPPTKFAKKSLRKGSGYLGTCSASTPRGCRLTTSVAREPRKMTLSKWKEV